MPEHNPVLRKGADFSSTVYLFLQNSFSLIYVKNYLFVVVGLNFLLPILDSFSSLSVNLLHSSVKYSILPPSSGK